jgi:hypothetical protein
MKEMKNLGISGCLYKDSYHRFALKVALGLVPDQIERHSIPFFDQNHEMMTPATLLDKEDHEQYRSCINQVWP